MFQDLKISNEEKNALVDSIAWITYLIAGADGQIDSKEKEWAKKVTEIRGYKHPEILDGYYSLVGDSYEKTLGDIMDSNPGAGIAEDNLAKLNDILCQLDNELAYTFYKSFTSFATHVAKASGGFLGFGSISASESKLITLPMINPIELG